MGYPHVTEIKYAHANFDLVIERMDDDWNATLLYTQGGCNEVKLQFDKEELEDLATLVLHVLERCRMDGMIKRGAYERGKTTAEAPLEIRKKRKAVRGKVEE
jgi:hypothetical protein